MTKKHQIIIALISLAALLTYYFTSPGKTPYDYFTRLADAFLQGKYYLTESSPWLSELVPGPNNTFFVIQPPMPAIIAVPFRLLFEGFQQQYLAHILGAGIVVLTMTLTHKITMKKNLSIYSGILAGFGSIIWYLSATGSVWYLGQICAAFFLMAALTESFSKKRPFFVGIFIGAAFLSRLHTILSLPLFLFLLFDKKQWIKNYFFMGLGMLPFFAFNFLYNFNRFGTIFDKGYFLVPGIHTEPWFSKGILNIAYIPEHLRVLFLQTPLILDHPPFIQPSWYGLAIWITTPVFVFSILAPFKKMLVKMHWLSILLIFITVSLRGGTGWTQFGYRYAVDFYPFLILLTIMGIDKTGLKKYHWLLLFIGVIVNLWGVLWINKFNWVSF